MILVVRGNSKLYAKSRGFLDDGSRVLFAPSPGCKVGKAPPSPTGVFGAEFPRPAADSPKTARVRAGGMWLRQPGEVRGRAALGVHERARVCTSVHGCARVCTSVHECARVYGCGTSTLPQPSHGSVTSAGCGSRPKPVSAGTYEVGEKDRQSKPRGEQRALRIANFFYVCIP